MVVESWRVGVRCDGERGRSSYPHSGPNAIGVSHHTEDVVAVISGCALETHVTICSQCLRCLIILPSLRQTFIVVQKHVTGVGTKFCLVFHRPIGAYTGSARSEGYRSRSAIAQVASLRKNLRERCDEARNNSASRYQYSPLNPSNLHSQLGRVPHRNHSIYINHRPPTWAYRK